MILDIYNLHTKSPPRKIPTRKPNCRRRTELRRRRGAELSCCRLDLSRVLDLLRRLPPWPGSSAGPPWSAGVRVTGSAPSLLIAFVLQRRSHLDEGWSLSRNASLFSSNDFYLFVFGASLFHLGLSHPKTLSLFLAYNQTTKRQRGTEVYIV